ncbi:MAG: pyrimidine dimer DNA glycosylase/endonuclease V, partial [Candidatus Nanopelagicaceae bacterium]
MNIFVTSPWPAESAICLPDKHVVKMPLECCQMLSIVAS